MCLYLQQKGVSRKRVNHTFLEIIPNIKEVQDTITRIPLLTLPLSAQENYCTHFPATFECHSGKINTMQLFHNIKTISQFINSVHRNT